jgi:hypothetical protein
LSKTGVKCFACSVTDGLILAGSYWFCQVHKVKRDEVSAKNNGSEAHLKSLRDHFARKKGPPDVTLPVAQVVNDNPQCFASLLAPFKNWLLSGNIIIYDTESDGVGATHILELTREYHFYSLATGKSLNIWARKKNGRVDPEYTHQEAARQILSFCQNADFMIAYEPPSNDRNRLKRLLGDQVYAAQVEPKVIDFKRTIINSLFTTDDANPNRIYLRGLTQPDVYDNLLQVGRLSSPEPDGFLHIPDPWKSDVDMKCRADVHMLHNLFIYFQSILSQ